MIIYSQHRNRIYFAHNEGLSEHATIYYKDVDENVGHAAMETRAAQAKIDDNNNPGRHDGDGIVTAQRCLDQNLSDDINRNANDNRSNHNQAMDGHRVDVKKPSDLLDGASALLEGFLPKGASLRQVAFSSDGQYIAFAYNAGLSGMWDDFGCDGFMKEFGGDLRIEL